MNRRNFFRMILLSIAGLFVPRWFKTLKPAQYNYQVFTYTFESFEKSIDLKNSSAMLIPTEPFKAPDGYKVPKLEYHKIDDKTWEWTYEQPDNDPLFPTNPHNPPPS